MGLGHLEGPLDRHRLAGQRLRRVHEERGRKTALRRRRVRPQSDAEKTNDRSARFLGDPILSKVYNDGFDELATHTRGSNQRYRPLLDETAAQSFRMQDSATITDLYQRRFQKKLGIRARILSKYQTLIGNLLK